MPGKRIHVVMARFDSEELKRLETLRKMLGMTKGRYIRERALLDIPSNMIVPEINREAWTALSRSASNLNQIAHHLNMSKIRPGDERDILRIRGALDDFRKALIGARPEPGEDPE